MKVGHDWKEGPELGAGLGLKTGMGMGLLWTLVVGVMVVAWGSRRAGCRATTQPAKQRAATSMCPFSRRLFLASCLQFCMAATPRLLFLSTCLLLSLSQFPPPTHRFDYVLDQQAYVAVDAGKQTDAEVIQVGVGAGWWWRCGVKRGGSGGHGWGGGHG